MMWIVTLAGLLMLAAPAERVDTDQTHRHQVVVYGGTAGGVITAVAAAREGADVALVVRGRHLGGLVSSGLGATDAGRTDTVGGIAREYFTRLGAAYGRTGVVWRHEPSVAEAIFDQMAAEANVKIYRDRRLRLDPSAVEKQGARLTAFQTESGERFAADVFVDATYEGDLLAMAGVSYHLGRESRDTYGEPHAGVRPLISTSPPGGAEDNKGLLPGIYSGPVGEVGQEDLKLQAYNFRLCLTRDPANRVPIHQPTDYDPRRYTLLARHLAERSNVPFERLVSIAETPNQKTDVNNIGSLSTDLVNGSWGWPEAGYDERERIWLDHKSYTLGLLWFLAHDPRVPEQVRREAVEWGLAKNEFVDNGHWPRELYVREARRLVGQHVMTEHDLVDAITKPDSIGMGSYMMDTHYVQRTLAEDGAYVLEGPLQAGAILPYEISMRSLLPRPADAENLVVPVCVSASHVAWSSIRMEPVFMMMGHAGGIIAALAAERQAPVQSIPYEAVRQKLEEQGQVLHYRIPGRVDPADLEGIVIDDEQVEYEGQWAKSSSGEPFVGRGYRHDNNHAKGHRRATYRFDPPRAGEYEVRLFSAVNRNRAERVPVTIRHADGEETVHINQRVEAPGPGPHHTLGAFRFVPASQGGRGGEVTISNEGTSGFVIADAVQVVPAAPAGESEESPAGRDAARRAAAEHVRGLVYAAQLPDGALRMNAVGDKVRIVPYFSNYAALGLLGSHEVAPDPRALEAVRRWIVWYADNQEPDGTINDHAGTLDDYGRTDKRDSTDSYAATFLVLADRYWAATRDESIRPKLVEAARGAVRAIEEVWNADGLTWAKPDYKVKYLMDNLEVNAGLGAGASFFQAVGEEELSRRCLTLQEQNAQGLKLYWQPEHGYYAWAVGSSGHLHTGFDRWYPHCVITLFALAYVQDPPRPLWERIQQDFGDSFDRTPDYWTVAARNAGTPGEYRDYFDRFLALAQQMTPEERELNRLGWALLALSAEEAPLPSVEIPQ